MGCNGNDAHETHILQQTWILLLPRCKRQSMSIWETLTLTQPKNHQRQMRKHSNSTIFLTSFMDPSCSKPWMKFLKPCRSYMTISLDLDFTCTSAQKSAIKNRSNVLPTIPIKQAKSPHLLEDFYINNGNNYVQFTKQLQIPWINNNTMLDQRCWNRSKNKKSLMTSSWEEPGNI